MSMLRYKQILIEVSKIAVITAIVTGICLVYIINIGIPKTDARNWYNKYSLAATDNRNYQAQDYLQKAAQTWPEQYIIDTLP